MLDSIRTFLFGSATQQELIPAIYQLAIKGTLVVTLGKLTWNMSQDLATWWQGEAPAVVKNSQGVPFGKVSRPLGLGHNIVRFPVWDNIHKCLVGGTRMGKTETLAQMVVNAQQGICFLCNDDGKVIDRIIAALPEERLEKLVVLDARDPSWIIPIGSMSRFDDYHLQDTVANQWINFFETNFNVEGMYMTSEIIYYAAKVVFALPDTTFYDVYKMVDDPSYRLRLLARLNPNNDEHRPYINWWKERISDDKAEAKFKRDSEAFLRRAGQMFKDRMLQYTLGKRPQNMNYRYWMDNGYTVLIRTPESLGEHTVRMIQAIHAISFWQAALTRDSLGEGQRKPFWLLADEPQTWLFQNHKTIDNIFSKAAKYRLFMILSFQSFAQIAQDNPKLLQKIQSNAPDMLVFRTSKKQMDIKIKSDKDFELDYQERYTFVASVDGSRYFKCRSLGRIEPVRDHEAVSRILKANRDKFNIPFTRIKRELDGRFNEQCELQTNSLQPLSNQGSQREILKSSNTFTFVE